MVKLGLSSQQQFVVKIGRRSPAAGAVWRKAPPKDLAVKLGEDSRKEEPVRWATPAATRRPRGGGERAVWRIDSGA